MIAEFFASFGLFWETYLASISASIVLSVAGIFAVTRGQVFLPAALGQASLLGIAVALRLEWEMFALIAVVFSVLAAAFIGRQSHDLNAKFEEKTGWVFLFSASLAVILLVDSPNGIRELYAISASTIIGAGVTEAILFSVLALAAVSFLFVRLNNIILFLSDPVMAAAVGMNIVLWGWGISLATGFVTGLAINTGGMLFVFGAMILPPLTARNLGNGMTFMIWMTPVIAVMGTVAGLILSLGFDLPPGQSAVFAQAFLLLVSWILRELKFWFLPR